MENKNINSVNLSYLEAFQQSKYPNIDNDKNQRMSWYQYKCTLTKFLATLDKDAAMTRREDIDAFLSGTKNAINKARHIKSFFMFLIMTNIKNCRAKVGRDLLIKIIEM